MKTNKLFIILLLVRLPAFCQTGSFRLPCDTVVSVGYAMRDNLTDLRFNWRSSYSLAMPDSMQTRIKSSKQTPNAAQASELLSNVLGTKVNSNNFGNLKFNSDTSTILFDYQNEYIKNDIVSLDNKVLTERLYQELTIARGKKDCDNSQDFINNLKSAISEVNKNLAAVSPGRLMHPDILNVDSLPDMTKNPMYANDVRNPIAFTTFIIRNPKVNGKEILSIVGNFGSYHYIRPGSLINVLFNEALYNEKLKGARISIQAYIKRKDESVVPIAVSGYYNVSLASNGNDFEKNHNKNIDVNASTSSLNYNYTIESTPQLPIQAEINTSAANPQIGDKLIVTVTNVSDANVSFTTIMEYDDFGWSSEASGGFAWVNFINTGNKNFLAAGTAGYSFTYKLEKGARFWKNFFMPSFGPELSVLQDKDNNTLIGLGVSVSEFLRTVKVGFGWNLVGNNGKPYVSIGVNFVEGIESISTILKRSKSNP
jgi:hypothetical protein